MSGIIDKVKGIFGGSRSPIDDEMKKKIVDIVHENMTDYETNYLTSFRSIIAERKYKVGEPIDYKEINKEAKKEAGLGKVKETILQIVMEQLKPGIEKTLPDQEEARQSATKAAEKDIKKTVDTAVDNITDKIAGKAGDRYSWVEVPQDKPE
jgi:hypothetical protein